MANLRGNRYSRGHTKLNPDTDKVQYWNFSWFEMGIYDLPAIIDYILKVTGDPDLHYIGYSQGTTAFFVMGAKLPDYNRKIRDAHLMAPIAFQKNTPSMMLRMLSLAEPWLTFSAPFMGLFEYPFTNNVLSFMRERICPFVASNAPMLCGKVLLQDQMLTSTHIKCVSIARSVMVCIVDSV